ncbi:universal stress protein [Algoriphagus boritolerans]|uniref:universal stress protein n=1 Tax=Algoriphagus boritolerans TaxID=308111 RepID=UPI000ABDE815
MMKVLVPYDFSQTADYALNFATGLSENYSGIEITVLHIIETPVATGMGTMGGGLDSVPEFENQIYFIELIERRKKTTQGNR